MERLRAGLLVGFAAALLILSACSGPTTKQLIAQCTLDADRLYTSTDPYRSMMVNAYVGTCMEARGYVALLEGPACTSNPDRETDPRCYRR